MSAANSHRNPSEAEPEGISLLAFGCFVSVVLVAGGICVLLVAIAARIANVH